MLKVVSSSLVAALVLSSVSGLAQASINDDLQNICTIVKADDKGELRKKMQQVENEHYLKIQDYYTGITCGGQSLLRTAFINNAVEVGTLLIKKMPKSQLAAPEADGKTLADWSAEQGLNNSPLVQTLNERM